MQSLLLIEGNVNEDALRISLGNALQLVLGQAPGFGMILHVNADSNDALENAIRDFAKVLGVTGVITLAQRLRE